MVAQITVNAIHAPNFMRSAMAPVMRATVITANVTWNATTVNAGTPVVASGLKLDALPSAADSTRPCRPKNWNGLPKNWLIPVVAVPKAIE